MNNIKSKKEKVFVGLSGGVDSSVSAYLLKKQGYDVTGVFIKAWYPDFLPCNWRDEMRDAMRICAKLDIPFLVCDLESEYKKFVIDNLISGYERGETPNPDVMCNKYIKFDGFLRFAMTHNADYIATGHYSGVEHDINGSKMLIPKDLNKDQTYFLWTIKQENLQKVLFPLQNLEKSQVRKIAEKNNLHTASKKDSQGLCFIGHVDMESFLKRYIDINPGDVLNTKNQVIGKHKGSVIYTLGQRHGFDITENIQDREKYYVVSKDKEKNTITVSNDKKTQDVKELISLKNINLINNLEIGNETKYQSKIRYRSNFYETKILELKNDSLKIKIKDLNEKIAIGQSVVIYRDSECFGGGIVSES